MLQVVEVRVHVGGAHRFAESPFLESRTDQHVDTVVGDVESVAGGVFPAPAVVERHRLRNAVLRALGGDVEVVFRDVGAVAAGTHQIAELAPDVEVLQRLEICVDAGLHIVRLAPVLVHVVVHVGDRVLGGAVGGIPVVPVTVLADMIGSIVIVGILQRAHHKHVVKAVPVDAARGERTVGFRIAVVQGLADLEDVEVVFPEHGVFVVDAEIVTAHLRDGGWYAHRGFLVEVAQTEGIDPAVGTARHGYCVAHDRSVVVDDLLEPVGAVP